MDGSSVKGPPALRGHHLICLHFYRGEGYSREFVVNLTNLLERAREKGVTIETGADDVCRSCPSLKGSRCSSSVTADEEIREMDREALKLLELTPGRAMEWAELRRRAAALFRQWHDRYCRICGWKEVCGKDRYFRELRAGQGEP